LNITKQLDDVLEELLIEREELKIIISSREEELEIAEARAKTVDERIEALSELRELCQPKIKLVK